MSKDVVATSENIENISKMLNLLQIVKKDSGKLREISLDNTGWEGMDATAFNESLKSFTKDLDETSTGIEEALKEYKSKQEEQLNLLISSEAKARGLIEEKDAEIKRQADEIKKAKEQAKQYVKDSFNKRFNNNSSSGKSSSPKSLEKQQNELYDLLKAYYETNNNISSSLDNRTANALKNIVKQGMNRYPGNNITDKQINEIINKYGTDGFSKDEVKQIWDEYYTKG